MEGRGRELLKITVLIVDYGAVCRSSLTKVDKTRKRKNVRPTHADIDPGRSSCLTCTWRHCGDVAGAALRLFVKGGYRSSVT